MPKPYSLDLRDRIISAYQAGETSTKQLATQFQVSGETVRRYLIRFKTTGSVNPDPHGGGRKAIIGLQEVAKLAEIVGVKPDDTIAKMSQKYTKRFGVKMGTSSMQRALARFGITSKKSL